MEEGSGFDAVPFNCMKKENQNVYVIPTFLDQFKDNQFLILLYEFNFPNFH